MDREKLIRTVASLSCILMGSIGLLSNTLLHRDLGFWYILAGFTVGLIGVGFFKIGKKRKITKQPENKR